jgi:hypothetical protein
VSPIPGALKIRRSCSIRAAARCAGILTAATLAVVPAGAAGSPLPPQIHTVAGGGTCSGAVTSLGPCDGISATSTPIVGARSVAALPAGGFLYVDSYNDLVREVLPSGKVVTVAGTSADGKNPSNLSQYLPSTTDVDCVPATESGLDNPVAVAALPDGSFLITENGDGSGDGRVRLVSTDGIITTVAGVPPDTSACPGAGITDTGTSGLDYPSDAVPTANGGVLIADTYGDVNADGSAGAIMLLSSTDPGATIQQIAGGASGAGSCDDATSSCQGVQAWDTQLDVPDSVSEIPGDAGAYLISEYGSDAVREISQESLTGTFTTVAGQPGSYGYSGDGGRATAALLDQPDQVLALSGGGFLIVDTANNVVREVAPDGIISTIAGNGISGYTGDGGDATAAPLSGPSAVTVTNQNVILIADDNNGAIREITQPSVSMFSITPSRPNGRHRWYTRDPIVSVNSTRSNTINCVLDPIQAPPAFAAMVPGCTYAGAGAPIIMDGIHTLYAASQNIFGDQENPVSITFKVDATPPTITCDRKPVFRYGQRTAEVTAVLKDAVSGPASRRLKVRVNTHRLGAHKARVRGRNRAGLSTTVQCPYVVRART